jgi:hypothetical protein
MSLRDTSWIKFSDTSTANQYLQEKTGTQLGQIWQQSSKALSVSILQKTPSSTARRSLLNGKRSWITTIVRYPILHVVLRNSWGAPHGFVWQGKYMVIQNWNYMSSTRLKFWLHNFSWMQEFAEVVIDYSSPANKDEKSSLAHWWCLVFNICRILQSRFWVCSIEWAAECDKFLIQKTGKEPFQLLGSRISLFVSWVFPSWKRIWIL